MTNKKKRIDYKKTLKNISKNYWAISTLVLTILLIIILTSGRIGNTIITSETAGQKVLDFANKQGANASLISVKDEGSLFEVILSIKGQNIPVYVTKDGTNLIPTLIPLTTEAIKKTDTQPTPTPQKNIPKSDKPTVEAFVMAYCPYGTQIEKGLLPVVQALGDKINFKIKFVYYAMHGQKEINENTRQYCIQKEQNDKYISYLTCFLEAGDFETCLSKENIDTTRLENCITTTDKEFDITKNFEDKSSWLSGRYPKFDINKEDNEKYNVAGSPTLVINGATTQAGRDSISLLNAICSTFNVAPKECNTQFKAVSPSPGFGWSTTETTNNAAACGA